MQRLADLWTPAGDADSVNQSQGIQAHGWLAHASLILGLMGAYLVLHFVLRLMLSPTLGVDDAEQILFAQEWDFGYRFRQPPLFTWLLLPVIDWVGPGVLAVSIVRYALLAVTYGFFYLAALHWIDDRRLAALSAFSFSLIYVFAYYAHHDLTHTTALGALIAASLYVFARLSETPKTHHYLLLGLCFGFGMLAKWNFVMLAVGLPLTCLLLPAYRSLILTWKSLLAVAVMALVMTPTAFWMFDHGQTTGGVSSEILSGKDDPSGIAVVLQGGAALLSSIILFPMPFLVLFLITFGATFLQNGRETLPRETMKDGGPHFLGWLMLVIFSLHALLIPVFGAVNFTER